MKIREDREVQEIGATRRPISRADPETLASPRASRLSGAGVVQLQRAAGNAAVTTLLQRSLETATDPKSELNPASLGPPVEGHGPVPVKLNRKQRTVLNTLLPFTGPVGKAIEQARLVARVLGATVGLGIGGEAGAFGGVLAGTGLYVTADGDIGAYGDVGAEAGFLYSASATIQVAITKGGLENFAGPWLCFNVTLGEGLVGGGMVITDLNMGFLGIGYSMGIGAGQPVDFYVSVSNTWTTEPLVNAPL